MTDARLEFALLMRAMAAKGLDDMTFLHCSIRSAEMLEEGTFLINSARPAPFWATGVNDSSIVYLHTGGIPYGQIPNSQWWIHRDIYLARPELTCILHIHTSESVAVASTDAGLRQVHQGAALFTKDFLGWMPYGGLNQYEGLVEALGRSRFAVLMQGHGAIIVGRTIGEAYELMMNLQDCCSKELLIPSDVVDFPKHLVEAAHHDWIKDGRAFGAHSWPAERQALQELSSNEGFI